MHNYQTDSKFKQPSTGGQHTRLTRMLRLTNSFPDRLSLVEQFSGQPLDSIKKLNNEQAEGLICFLEDRNDSMNRMRRKIMAYCHQIRWRIQGTKKVDFKRLDNWCVTRGKFKKKLQAHTAKELPQLVSQFENVFKSQLKTY